jgi:hypothetical protein
MDCVVKSWILDSLTDDLAEIVSSHDATAQDAWLAVESQFMGNRETWAIQLETKFRNFVQGDLSVTEYYRRLKKMADDLTALGEVVIDRTLVLNVLRGLNECFTHVGALLRRARYFPTFLQVKDDLSLEDLTLGSRPPSPADALTATTKPPPQSGAGNGTSSKPNRRGKSGGGGGGGSGGGGGPTQQHHTAQQQRSNRLEASRPSASPPGAGPPSTTLGRAPSSCGPVPAILLRRPYLDRRSSNRRSSPNNSLRSSRRCSRTSFLLLQLAPLRVANGGQPAPTTPWPASPPGIHSRSPPRSARQR